MNQQSRQVFAIIFSVLLVTATLTPSAAALDPPDHNGTGGPLIDADAFLPNFSSSTTPGQGNGNGNGNGNPPNRTTTTDVPDQNNTTTATTTTQPGNGNDGPENGSDGPPNGSSGPPGNQTGPPENGSNGPPNGSNGPPENPGGGPPENPGSGPPENPGGGPPENRGSGPPAWAGGNDDPSEDRGPPEWVTNPETPPGLDGNRSALGNNSSAFQNASINVSVSENASAVEYRLAAIDALQDAEFDGPGRSADQHRTEALEALDDSLPYVLDANRTTSADLFEYDKEAGTPPHFAPNVTGLLVRSDQQLARTAITDAERVFQTLQARNASFDTEAVRANISEAKQAFDRAEQFRGRGQGHVAISQYRVAWIHAQQALDQMDFATQPNVTITTHRDLPHTGNVTYTVRGRVFDVRGHELDVRLSLYGVNQSVTLNASTTPGEVGTFEKNVTLTQNVTRITVTATDPNRAWAPDSEDHESETGQDILRLDGDGLPDYYEVNVTGTDPLDPDSNSTQTSLNESKNGTIDGTEDFDGDGIATYTEYKLDLDPLENDTDGDGLTDGFERRYSGIDPRTPDTDNDTVPDPAEDLDNDTLSTEREQTFGTNPLRADTDADGLNDSQEIENGTDALLADTDDDGLTDPDEYEVGTDPTIADTDGDGVLDGNETFATTAKNESVGAAVNVSGKGNAAETVTISNETNEQIETETVSNASASEVLHVDTDQEFEQANLSIEYDEKQVENESALAVYTYDPKLQTYVKLSSNVDTANDTVTGTTPHFSSFVVLNQTEWNEFRQSRAKPKPNYALSESFGDLSGWNCTGDCTTENGDAVVGQPGADSVETALAPGGPCLESTQPGDCPDQGDDNETDNDDGEDNDDGPPPQLGSANLSRSITLPNDTVEVTFTASMAAFAEESNASVTVAVAVGGDVRRVVSLDGEDGKRVTSTPYINETFKQPTDDQVTVWVQSENLSGASIDYADIEVKRDSDGDGLTNSLEKLGIKTGTGRIYTDPYDADSDGDGLSDSEEILGYVPSYVDSNSGHYRMVSDPLEVDTDSDGVDDYDELRVWETDPRDSDTDGDGLTDLVDRRPKTESNAPNVKITSEIEYREDVNVAPKRDRDNYNEFIFVRVSDREAISDFEVNGYYDPYYGDSFWKASEATQREDTFQGTKNGYHVNTFSVPIYQHGVLNEIPEFYYVNATDANGNRVSIEVDPNQSDVLPDVKFAGAVPFLGGVAATAGAEAVGGSTAIGSGISVTTATTTGGAVLMVGAAAAYSYDQRPAHTYDSERVAGQQLLTAPSTEYVDTYPAKDTPFSEPVKLPSGSVYEPDEPVGDGHERGFGWEYVKRTPGINDYEDIDEVLKAPNVVHEDGKYDLVIGETNEGTGILLRLRNGIVVSAAPLYEDPLGQQVQLPDNVLEKIKNKHPEVGHTDKEVSETIQEIIENANEVYVDDLGYRMYVTRVGGKIMVLFVTPKGKIETAFAPSTGSGYSDERAKRYIKEQINRFEFVKIYEDSRIINVGIGE